MACSDCKKRVSWKPSLLKETRAPEPLIAQRKKCFCYLGDLLQTGYPCGERIYLSVDFSECLYNDPRIGEEIDFTCPQYLFDIGMYFINTDTFPNSRAWIEPICIPPRVIHESDAEYFGLYFQDLSDPNIYYFTTSCLPQFGVYDSCGNEDCCGCCKSEEDMATCDDLIVAIGQLGQVIGTISINIDALREEIICLRELQAQGTVDRVFIARAIEDGLRLSVENTNQVSQGLHLIAQSLSGTELPEQVSGETEYLDSGQMAELQPCSSSYYCPPGFIKDNSGNCIPISET